MNDDRSILRRLESQGGEMPRVRLPGSDASPAGGPAAERYEIEGEIARGDVGVVYRGRDVDLGRDVAVKVLRDEHLGSPEAVRRFVEEARIGGQLQHPGIVPVYELGVRDGARPFFAMRLVKGRTLADLLAARASPSEGRHALLAHFALACHTVAYAHARGVVHRDLKPGNVLVGAFSEVQVVDWGSAKVLGGASEARSEEAPRPTGAPSYAAPEQARDPAGGLTERADVFSLGAILCEVLTGAPPRADDAASAASEARLEDAVRRLDACGADAEPVALAKACLSARPEDRPRSAREVAEALDAHLSGAQRRAHAARVRAVEEQVKVEEQRRARRQTLAVAVAVVLVVLLSGAGLLAKAGVDATRERERTAAFDEAVREATRLQAAGDDWPGARAAAERASGFAGADATRRREVEALLAGVEASATAAERAAAKARREADLLAVLDEVALRRGDDFDARRVDAEYVAATSDPAALEGFDRRVELAAHLDRWVWLRRKKLPDLDWRALDARARALDPDPWRNDLRAAAAEDDRDRLRALAADPATEEQGPGSLDLLGTVLGDGGDADAAAKLLGRAAERHPSDFWIRYHLGDFAGRFTAKGGRYARPDPAVAHFTAAVALRPTSASAHDRLGIALWSRGQVAAAVGAWRTAVRLAPRTPSNHHNLGIGLRDLGDLDGSAASIREAIRLDPNDAFSHASLGATLEAKGDLDGALDAYRTSLRLDPRSANAHNAVGVVLGRKGDFDGVLAACREAVRLDPTFARPHLNIGFALASKGDFEGAIAAQKEALRLDPDESMARHNLGLAFLGKGDVDGAIDAWREAVRRGTANPEIPYNLGNLLAQRGELWGAAEAFREAIRLDPKRAPAHVNLGNVKKSRGDFAGAISCYHAAIAADPKVALAHANLGHAHLLQGELDLAVASFRAAAAIEPDHPWIRPALAEAERLAAAHARLPAVLRGEDRPKDAEEWKALAEVAYRAKEHDASVRCWKAAFEADPRLAADPSTGSRYDAACSAALSKHFDEALDWLRADLRLWGERVPADAEAVARTMHHWRSDPDLSPVRDLGVALSEDWGALWADVARLLVRAEKAASAK